MLKSSRIIHVGFFAAAFAVAGVFSLQSHDNTIVVAGTRHKAVTPILHKISMEAGMTRDPPMGSTTGNLN